MCVSWKPKIKIKQNTNKHPKQKSINEDVEKLEHLYMAGGNV